MVGYIHSASPSQKSVALRAGWQSPRLILQILGGLQYPLLKGGAACSLFVRHPFSGFARTLFGHATPPMPGHLVLMALLTQRINF
jgi:hypothetical protein